MAYGYDIEIRHSRLTLRGLRTRLLLLFAACHLAVSLTAAQPQRLWPMADDIRLGRQPDSLSLSFTLLPRGLRIPRGQVLVVEPWLCCGADSLLLPTLGIYGRGAYYGVVRGGENPFQWSDGFMLRARDVRDSVAYSAQVAAPSWLLTPQTPAAASGLQVRLRYMLVDGCLDIVASLLQQADILLSPATLAGRGVPSAAAAGAAAPVLPASAALQPGTAASAGGARTVLRKEGRAYIDFVVNRTDIVPTLHHNTRELQRIRQSLDSLVADTTAVITRFAVCGYASPEGSYANNVRLARGRSQTLAAYICNHWGVPCDILSTSFVPEDWQGLRAYVQQQIWVQRADILRIIDTEPDPDRRLELIRQRHPERYATIAAEVLPYLRHSDYVIEYEHVAPGQRRLSPYRQPADAAAGTLAATPADSAGAAPAAPATEAAAAYLALPEHTFAAAAHAPFHAYRPLLAVKSNLLFDAALAPNIEVEIPLGRRRRWSLLLEDWFPWFRLSHNAAGDANAYYRSDQRPTRHSYQVWLIGAEARYWLAPRCRAARPVLAGTFLGLYAAGGKYDVEWNSKGYQGEFTSFGITVGHAWPISRHWNLELSASLGYVGGPQRYYEAEFDDARLIYRHRDRLRYFGPTKLKLSLAWIIGAKAGKGGER